MSHLSKCSALIVIDMQEDFCHPHGSLAILHGREVHQKINTLLDYPGWALKIATLDCHPPDHISFASNHGPDTQAFTSQHTIHNPANEDETQTTLLWPKHCVENTPGAQLIPELHAHKLDSMVLKGQDPRVESYSGFGPPFRHPPIGMSSLHDRLQRAGITDVFCVGLAYDYCVKWTAMDAVELGFRSYIVEDATRAVVQDQGSVEALRGELRRAGVQVVGMHAEALVEVERAWS